MLQSTATPESSNSNGNDVVNNPEHYTHGTFEVIDEMLMAFGPQRTYDFCILNAWKYRSRAPYKGKMEQDMDKANRYMEMAHDIVLANPGTVYETHLIKSANSASKVRNDSKYGMIVDCASCDEDCDPSRGKCKAMTGRG